MDHCGLTVERHVLPSGLWFLLSGQLDRLNVESDTTVLFDEVDALSCAVEVDLSGLSVLGFAGAEMIAELRRRLAVVGRRLRITATNGIVDRAFSLRGAPSIGYQFTQMPRGGDTGVPVGVAATAFAADDLET
jgi:anti-anti-sigma regulatory factor